MRGARADLLQQQFHRQVGHGAGAGRGKLYLSGFFFSASSSWPTLAMPEPAGTTSTLGWCTASVSGARSVAGA